MLIIAQINPQFSSLTALVDLFAMETEVEPSLINQSNPKTRFAC